MKSSRVNRTKNGGRRKSPKYKRRVSIKSAEKILRAYYRKRNKGNVKKATRALRRVMKTITTRNCLMRRFVTRRPTLEKNISVVHHVIIPRQP